MKKIEKKCQVVLLPTEEESDLYLKYTSNFEKNPLIYSKGNTIGSLTGKHQHIYILSDEEIKGGEWQYTKLHGISQVKNLLWSKEESAKKIIATTDLQLLEHSLTREVNGFSGHIPLPKMSQDFIEAYVEEYNVNNQIQEVMVEFEEHENPAFEYKGKDDGLDVKVNHENAIIIHKVIIEKIICAANWYKELQTPIYGPTNIKAGIVFCGHGHLHCLHQMIATTGKRQAKAGPEVQGFLTSKNRFVDRSEGAKIALACGQIEKLNYSSTELYSEDLYK